VRLAVAAFVATLCVADLAAAGMGDPDTAALQVMLRARGYYASTIDGWFGPHSEDAVRAFQRSAGLPRTGFPGPLTRGALGASPLGSRLLSEGTTGWDVAALQYLLAWHGFPSGPFTGVFTARTTAAVVRFQRWAGVPTTGIAGPLTRMALGPPPATSPIRLVWPVEAPVGDRFGPRDDRFHAGVDFPANAGTLVGAAASGYVSWAGWMDGGFGYMVRVVHRGGVVTCYAHLAHVSVDVGQRVSAGELVGLVGATGHASGPHLHFEVRVRGAAVDPLPALS
jgi:peptidoglycan hydrolase-like protein with peptidoglycan-binding domain